MTVIERQSMHGSGSGVPRDSTEALVDPEQGDRLRKHDDLDYTFKPYDIVGCGICCNDLEHHFDSFEEMIAPKAGGEPLTKSQFFAHLDNDESMHVWAVRVAGWLFLYIGMMCIFSPILTFLDVIPVRRKQRPPPSVPQP